MATHRTNGSGSLASEITLLISRTGASPNIRLNHLDNLRIFLTSLVIIHHTAIPYGGLGSWEFRSPCFPPFSIFLATFNAVDQTFFMALFYWMAGYFSHLELARRGGSYVARRDFVKGRLKRLVVPSTFFTLVFAPMMRVMTTVRYCRLNPTACEEGISTVWLAVKTFVGYLSILGGIKGPVWFCVLLAIFDTFAAMLLASLNQRVLRPFTPERLQTSTGVATVLIPVILFAFLIRLVYPVGTIFTPLNLQPAFLPQYIFAYLVGHASAAAGTDTLRFSRLAPFPNPSASVPPIRRLTAALGTQMLGLGIVHASAYIFRTPHEDPLLTAVGGWRIPALLYAIWNEVGFVTIGPALVDLFAHHFPQPVTMKLPWRRFTVASADVRLARYAFATFLVHPVVSLGVELVVEWGMGCEGEGVNARAMASSPASEMSKGSMWNVLGLGPVVMTAAVGSVNAILSWGVAMGLMDLVPKLGRWV